MNLLVAVLCDAAADYGGKLNLLGTFDTLLTRQLPTTHPTCSVALRLLCERPDEGAHRLQLNFIDADGHPKMPAVDIPFDIRIPPDAIHLSRNFILNIQNLKFDDAGHYAFTVAIDGRLLRSIPLHVQHQAATV